MFPLFQSLQQNVLGNGNITNTVIQGDGIISNQRINNQSAGNTVLWNNASDLELSSFGTPWSNNHPDHFCPPFGNGYSQTGGLQSILLLVLLLKRLISLGNNSGGNTGGQTGTAQRIQAGEPFTIDFDTTRDKFLDTGWTGSVDTDPMGQLLGGSQYQGQFSNGQVSLTGFYEPDGSTQTFTRENNNLAQNRLNLWQRGYKLKDTITASGELDRLIIDPDFGPVGHVRFNQQSQA